MIRAFAEQVEEAGANLVAVTPGDHDAVLGMGCDLEVCRSRRSPSSIRPVLGNAGAPLVASGGAKG
jgi:hypothetical protein